MQIRELIEQSHQNAKNHGFWEDMQPIDMKIFKGVFNLKDTQALFDDQINAIGNRLMLIVGELAEAQEGLRHNDINNVKEELADVAIRLGDLCGGLGIDLETEILKKMEKNKTRPYKHGKLF